MSVKLDTKGFTCPIPILKVKKAMMKVAADDTLVVETTDPGSVNDFEIYCRTQGHNLIETSEEGGVFTFEIQKAP